jgi:hypothetical protein
VVILMMPSSAVILLEDLGYAPVADQGLAVLTDDDIVRLDVAVEHATAVGVLDGIARVEEVAEEFAKGERGCAGASRFSGTAPGADATGLARTALGERGCVSAPSFPRSIPGADASGLAMIAVDGLLEALAADQPHRVVRPAVGISPPSP